MAVHGSAEGQGPCSNKLQTPTASGKAMYKIGKRQKNDRTGGGGEWDGDGAGRRHKEGPCKGMGHAMPIKFRPSSWT